MANKVAIYCRLSREDGENKESNSISTQREMLKEYAHKNDLSIYKVYVDDGYSGTTFERPGFQNLLEDAEKKMFDTILVKDLSRIGRNYIQTGHYIEEYFPERNIRVIAVNDNFDSSRSDNDFAPFKNIINEWYTKDISKKVKFSHKLHQEQGIIPTGKLPLFGYIYDKDRNRIPDPETAFIVKEIYDLYISGKTRFEIAKILTEKKYTVPGYYYYLKYNYNPTKFSNYSEEQTYKWTETMIGRIVNSREYTGDLYVAKSYVKSFKNHKDMFNSINDQIVHKNRFPALISEEVYQIASKMRETNRRNKRADLFENRFLGLFKCKCCGKPLNAKWFHSGDEVVHGFICRNPDCKSKTFIRTEDALSLLDQELTHLSKILKNKEEFIQYCKDYIEETIEEEVVEDHSQDISNLVARNKKLEQLIEKLFEENLNNNLPAETFNKLLNKYNKEHATNEDLIKKYSISKPKKESIDYSEIATSFIYSLSSLKGNRDIGKLLQIFDGIYISKRKNKDGEVDFNYGKLGTLLKEFMNVRSHKK